jgi:hypothetical protein
MNFGTCDHMWRPTASGNFRCVTCAAVGYKPPKRDEKASRRRHDPQVDKHGVALYACVVCGNGATHYDSNGGGAFEWRCGSHRLR